MDDEGVLHTSHTDKKATSINSNTKPSIDIHHTPDSEVQVKDNTYYGYLTPEFGIFRDLEGQERAMDGLILNISREDIAEIIAMNESRNFLDMQNKSEYPPSIDKTDAPSIDGYPKFRRRALHQIIEKNLAGRVETSMVYTEMRMDLHVLKMAESSMCPRRTPELFYREPQ